jgi:hypothetical protein
MAVRSGGVLTCEPILSIITKSNRVVILQEIFAEANVDMISGGGQNLMIVATTRSADSNRFTGDEFTMVL